MLFNEIIDKDGIESVASKTNITNINLEYLYEENFEKLNRVKALGFLLILEREYPGIDIGELREEVKAYYDDHYSSEQNKVVMVAQDSVENSVSFFKIFLILALLGGGYYLYSEGKLDSLIQKIEDKQSFFDDTKALENNVSDANAAKVVVGKSEVESVRIETPVAPKVKTITLNDEVLDKNESVHTPSEDIASTKVAEDNKSVATVVKEVSKEFLAKKEKADQLVVEEEKTVETVSTITTININPTRGMLWFGFINLENKKRREFMKKTSTPFNIDNNRWLLVTGHGFLDIVSNDQTIEVADNKKHYFYIDSHEMREVSKKEFRELNGRRGW